MTTTTATPPRGRRPRRRDAHHRDRRSHQDLLGDGLPCRRRAQPAASGSGEVFGLLGPNGAGKTTTIGVLTTRVIPTGGQALVGGIDVVQHPTLVKQLIGVVSQQNTLDRQLTPFENLYWHGRLFGMGAKESRQTADDLLERFQLTRFAKASVYALSGGMAQRLMVARAIFHRPAVLFLDEPTAGLDPQGRLALWDLLEGLNADGQTIMLTTHYMEEADKLCDRRGDHGPRQDPGPRHPGRAEAQRRGGHHRHREGGRRPRRAGRGLQDPTRRPDQDPRPARRASSCRSAAADRLVPRVVEAAEAGGFSLADLSVAEPTLETVFIGLTGKELRD